MLQFLHGVNTPQYLLFSAEEDNDKLDALLLAKERKG
jgi:hypothetical protein